MGEWEQDKELCGNADEGEQHTHATTAMLSTSSNKKPIKTIKDRTFLADFGTQPDVALKGEITSNREVDRSQANVAQSGHVKA